MSSSISNASSSHPAKPRDEPIATLWRLMSGYRLPYGAAIVALCFANALAYLAPLVGSATLDLAIAGRQEADVPQISRHIVAWLGGADALRAHLWLGAVVMAALTAFSGLFSFAKGWLAALASDGIARDVKNRLYNHLQHLPARYHDRADSGDLVQRCTSDVETVRMCLSAQIVEIGNAAILVVTAIPLLLLLHPGMTALSFALVVPIVIFGFVYFRRVKYVFRKVDEAEGRVTSRVQENLHGIRVVRSFARQEHEKQRFGEANAEYRDRSLNLIRLMAWYWSASDLVCLLQNGIVLIGGAWFVALGQLTVGGLFAFLTILNMLLWPVRMMGRILTDLGKTSVALGRLQEILTVAEETDTLPLPAEEDRRSHARPTLPAPVGSRDDAGRIEFRDVVFTHALAPDGTGRVVETTGNGGAPPTHALNGVSFSVAAGETVALLGPSGSGKSTLIHLLLRLYDPQRGSILLDGRDLQALGRKAARAQFGVVMQEPFLYSKTLRENIRFGRSTASEADVTEAARIAAVHDTIVGFDAGYDTLIGERGITLSGGQRQRVAIARAVLRDPPVLVLDDALSAVDSETEFAIVDALRQRRGRRTTLLIAHRLSTVTHADRIVVLEQGRVTQVGTHEELVACSGLYQRLWRIQTRIEAEEAESGLGRPSSLPETSGERSDRSPQPSAIRP